MICVWFKIIIVGTLLALLVDGDNGNDSSICRNFTFSATETTYIPSQIIHISSFCNMTTVCPSWNVTSAAANITILRNDTQVTGQNCTRNMSIQVISFEAESRKRIQLIVDFINPSNECTKIINVEKSDDTEFCQRDDDCYNPGQLCSAYSRCSCPTSFVFVRNLGRCYPEISRLYGQCTYSDQCRASSSICKDSACQCPEHHFPDQFFFNCLPEARGFGEECATDRNCQEKDIHSWCIWGRCACKSNYFQNNNFCQQHAAASGSSRTHFNWMGILMAVTVMFSRS